MGLQWTMPKSLQKQLKIKSDALVLMARSFMPVAADLKIWTFYETIDTDLTDGKVDESDRVSFQAPITSIKSAILDLHHEVDRPLQANHADCAAFGLKDEYTKWKFIWKLRDAAVHAQNISLKSHVTIGLDKKVEVEVHGFYETRDKGAAGKRDERHIRLWSTSSPLVTFLKDGPAKCLHNRLQEKTVPPTRTQMINAASSRRTSFRQPVSSSNATPIQHIKETQKSGGGRQGTASTRPSLGKLSRKTISELGAAAGGATGRRSSLPFIDRLSSPEKPPPSVPGLSRPSGLLTGRSNGSMPSVLISEHIDETNDTPKSSTALSVLNSKETNMNAQSKARIPVPGNQNERLLPLDIPSPRSLAPISQSQPETPDSEDSGMESIEGETSTVGPLMRPDPNSQKLVWVHIPFNNPKWVNVCSKAC